MARIELTDTNWVDLTTLATLDEGSSYWLQANSTINMNVEKIYFSQSEPADLLDGATCHDVRFKYAGDSIYVRSQTGTTSLKLEGVN